MRGGCNEVNIQSTISRAYNGIVCPACDGVTDNTNIFQKLLNRLGDLGEGALYVPT